MDNKRDQEIWIDLHQIEWGIRELVAKQFALISEYIELHKKEERFKPIEIELFNSTTRLKAIQLPGLPLYYTLEEKYFYQKRGDKSDEVVIVHGSMLDYQQVMSFFGHGELSDALYGFFGTKRLTFGGVFP